MRLPMASLLEGFVSQLLADYLSNYVQGIHPEQFRLGLWNGVAQLENLELRLEAFDYLQLPVAIKNGVVGRLKIQVPWKKLGREPILIGLQDIYICACPRNEFEWKSEALEARSSAAKKAKLAAAELAKLSARISGHISDDDSNQSFFSYLTTKILDNIQVIAENVHFRYMDQKTDPEMAFSFGIKFSHLTMNTEQTFSGVAGPGRARPNLVTKLVEIKDFCFYWNTDEDKEKDLLNDVHSQIECTHVIHPFNASLRFMINKNPLLDGSTPQYSTAFEINKLDFTLEDRQLHEMLLLWDALAICQMREKYGHVRPAVGQHGYARREDGWQKVWWHYAVQAVLVDVRKNLHRTAWSYLGWRIDMRRKYVLLYKEKLDCLWTGKPAAEQSLHKLDELEKELDLDEILAFRSTAESSLQDQGTSDTHEKTGGSEKMESRSEVKLDDLSSQKHRSWLNLLSLGMLGAAGSSAASEQFAGVLPDDIIEDIFEATKYHPRGLMEDNVLPKGCCRFAVTTCVNGVSIYLRQMHPKEAFASLDMQAIDVRMRVWQKSTEIFIAVETLQAADLCQSSSAYPIVLGNEGTILPRFPHTGEYQQTYAEAVLGKQNYATESSNSVFSKRVLKDPLLVVEVEMLSEDSDFDFTIKITTKPLEFVYSPMLMKQMKSFISRPTSLQTLKDLIFSSLNRLQSREVRLQSKAELTLAFGKRVGMLIEAQRPILIFPKSLNSLDSNHLIIIMNTLQVTSIDSKNGHSLEGQSAKKEQPHLSSMEVGLNFLPETSVEGKGDCNSNEVLLNEFIHPAIYNKFHLQLTGVQAIVTSHLFNWQNGWRGPSQFVEFHVAKCFDAEGVFEICALPDEPALTRFKLHGDIPYLHLTFSSKKWNILKSFFSNDDEEDMQHHDDSSIELENNADGLCRNETPAPYFKIELMSKSVFLFIHSEEEKKVHSCIPLLAKGEDASLTFLDSGLQRKLQFFVTALHIDKTLQASDYGPYLSLHSVSNFSVVGLFVPNTIWRWDWKASTVMIVLRGEGFDAQQIVVVNTDVLEHVGSWKNDDFEYLSLKIMKLTIRSDVCVVDRQSECSGCHLCSANLLCIISAIEQQQDNEILHLVPKEDLAGLEITLLSEEKKKNVFISIPFSNVNLHFPKWRTFVRTLSFYRSTDPIDGNDKCKPDAPPTTDGQEKDKLGVCPISQDDQSSFIVQTSVIVIDIFCPDYHDFSSGKQNPNEQKRSSFANQIAEVSSTTCLDTCISAKLTLQVKSFSYRESLCNFEASVLKCEVNLKDCISHSSYHFPLLQLVGMTVNLDVELQSVMRKRMIMVHSCTVKRLDLWCSHSTLQFLKSLRFDETPHTESGVGFETILATASLQRGSILLTDERWNYNAPIFELRVKSLNSQIRWLLSDQLVCGIAMVLEADYHDFEKVAWEPFLEPWDLSCDFSLRFGLNILAQQIDLKLLSRGHFNINLTKAFFQAYLRAVDVFTDATKSLNPPKISQNKSFVGYAPYWLQNDTGVRLKYWLIGASTLEEAVGFIDGNDLGVNSQNIVDPGCSIPINIEKKPEQVFHIGRSNSSSERLADKRLYGGRHRMIRVELEGTSAASCPLSMDLVGAHTFYVPFSYSSNVLAESKRRKEKFKVETKSNENGDTEGSNIAFQMPVIYEVSGHYYSKIIRIYSTVSLVNATSIPMEVRFDIPFGVLPKVMEPIFPGEVIPLPVHLAETGQIRWRPMGSSHLWSETQSLSYILSASKLGTLRCFVSYPSNPSNAIFRCCMVVQESRIPTLPISAVSEQLFNPSTTSKERSITASITGSPAKVPIPMCSQASSPITRELVFQAPLVFKNCLPFSMELAINSSAGHYLSLHVPECDTLFVLEANTGHDLVLTMNVSHFLPASVKIASSTTLLECHKENLQNKITLLETVCFVPDSAHGPSVYGKTEISFNMMSGAREISVYVPFWIYNHSGVNLEIADGVNLLEKQDGAKVTQQVIASFSALENDAGSFETKSFGLQTVLEEPFCSANRVYTHGHFCGTAAMRSVGGGKRIISCIPNQATSTDGDNNTKELQHLKPNMYSPAKDTDLVDNRLRARVAQGFVRLNESNANWSRPFSLNSPGGMTTIVIPLSEGEGGWVLSVVSAPVLGASAGKTRTITFQPRFVLANICNQDLCFRQQGTDNFEYALRGKQACLLWSDMSRPLLVSLRFDDHGWDWSGAFVPDQLGDTQLKMRNLVTGATQMLRVEVQNAGSLENSSHDISSADNSLGTYLILLSDDESGFMPYRIENFSLERLRFFQSRCPDFESTLLPYSSCLYAWDEPWRPHQLLVEIPGEGCLGTFDLDDVREYPTVHVPATNQKPERWFSVNIHAEGPTRVLSFQDLVLHPRKDLCGISTQGPTTQNIEEYTGCNFAFSCCCTSIGISVIDISPQEILFATAKEVTLQLLQSPHEQNLNFSVSFIQLDNQLPLAQYPVMVLAGVCCLNESTLGKEEGLLGDSSNSTGFFSDQSAFSLSIAKWRRFTSSVDCFQKIHARLAPIQVQLDEHIVSCLIEFFGSSHDMGFHALHPVDSAQPSILAGSSTMALDRYRLLLDPKSTQLHLLKTLKFESIYRCWPASRAVHCLQSQSSKVLLLERGGKKIYIESLSIAPIELTVSFSSIPWRDGHLSSRQSRSFLGESGPFVQRSLMALFDIEGAPVQLKELSLAHPLARWDAIRGMIVRHYTRQLLHEIYKILGSAGFLGNPMGFIKSLGSGVRDFVSAPAKSFVQSPRQLAGGFAEGTQSLVNNTVFAVSNAATLISRVAKKGVTSLALGHQQDPAFQDYGVISELLEGLTGLLQSPVTGAERHGLPGILSGVAVGAVGVFARPIASILEVAGRTAQSIRSWSQPIQQAKRMRPPRHLNKGFPILPYSWDEAIGNAVLLEAAGSRLQSEVYVTCRPVMEPGRYVLLTERFLLIVRSSASTSSGRIGPQWTIDTQIFLDDVLHVERNGQVLNILMGSPRCPSRIVTSKKKQPSLYKRQLPTSSPLLHESISMAKSEDAEEFVSYLMDVLEVRSKSRTYLQL